MNQEIKKVYAKSIYLTEDRQLCIDKKRGCRRQYCMKHLGAHCDDSCPNFSIECFSVEEKVIIEVTLCTRCYWTEIENFTDNRVNETDI